MQSIMWKNAILSRNSLSQPPRFALFHSTPASLAKWKSKCNDTDEGGGGKKPSKNYIRYAVRQKRADTKKALKNFLLYGRSTELHLQDEDHNWCADDIRNRNGKVESSSQDFDDIPRSRNSGKSMPHSFGKNKRGGKRWQHKKRFYDEDDDHGQLRASFGKHRCYTWSFPSWGIFFETSTTGFEWRDESEGTNTKKRVWSESDLSDLDEEESSDIGSHSHRVTLGLPPTGPLKLDDIKSAFRVSALKWHPDKHQGSSQAIAEEKFKLCVDAYNSLCSTLKAT